MKYPALIINKAKLAENIEIIQKLCGDYPISFCAVTNCFCAIPEITGVYVEAGVRDFADAEMQNLKKIGYPGVTKWLLRLPMLAEAEDIVQYADISLNSELKTVEALSCHAVKLGKLHKIILMVDLGDLREGVLPQDAVGVAIEILQYPNIELYGIGASFNCLGGVIPNEVNLSMLVDIVQEIQKKSGVSVPVISGGGSGSIHLLTSFAMPGFVNNLWLGEAILFGRETSYQQRIGNMHEDVFLLETQIVELKEKPDVPVEAIDLNAFREQVKIEHTGGRMRAIVVSGCPGVYTSQIRPIDPQIEIAGQSDDYITIDVTRCEKKYEVGDVISFSISYSALTALSASEYVYKIYE